jgi:hypothetical protein
MREHGLVTMHRSRKLLKRTSFCNSNIINILTFVLPCSTEGNALALEGRLECPELQSTRQSLVGREPQQPPESRHEAQTQNDENRCGLVALNFNGNRAAWGKGDDPRTDLRYLRVRCLARSRRASRLEKIESQCRGHSTALTRDIDCALRIGVAGANVSAKIRL